MEKLTLNAEIRAKDETTADLKSLKKLAWVVYWKNQEPIVLKMEYSDFLKTFRKSWESNIINLKVGKKNIEVLVHQIQQNPITWDFIHIDFYAITRWETLTTKIALNFVGDSEAIKEGAILQEQLKEVEVKCLPKNLVDSFEVDLTVLKEIGSSIRVSDLKIDSEKFELLTNQDDVIVTANKPKVATETETEETTDVEGETETEAQ